MVILPLPTTRYMTIMILHCSIQVLVASDRSPYIPTCVCMMTSLQKIMKTAWDVPTPTAIETVWYCSHIA